MRGRIDWKYCLGLALTDPGFDFTVLSRFRTRLVDHDLQAMAFEMLTDRLVALGLITACGKQRTDATHVVAAVRDLNRLEMVMETFRAALEALAAAAPDWLATRVDQEVIRRYGARIDGWRLPGGKAKRHQLAIQTGRDGCRILAAVAGATAPAWLWEIPAMDVLRQVWLQQYTMDESGKGVIWRDADTHGLPPGRALIVSPYDITARHGEKRGLAWSGYFDWSPRSVATTPTRPAPGPASTVTRSPSTSTTSGPSAPRATGRCSGTRSARTAGTPSWSPSPPRPAAPTQRAPSAPTPSRAADA